MKVLFFGVHEFERAYLESEMAKTPYEGTLLSTRLTLETAGLANGYDAVCVFVHDKVNAQIVSVLKNGNTKLLLLRSAGFNHIDLESCSSAGIKVCRVPEYSPYAVAEHTIALLLALDRKIHRAVSRVKDLNFSLDHLVGFDLHGKTVGVVGTGKIGGQVCRILKGFGCDVLAYDPYPNQELVDDKICRYVELNQLFKESVVISLHAPLTKESHHLINSETLGLMRKGVFLINTSRGGLIESSALIAGLKSGRVAGAALDVYEEEESVFFGDHSFEVLADDVLARLLTFPNVIITAHQAFLTQEALREISRVTVQSVDEFVKGRPLTNEVLSVK